jgi:hypothetical protein
MPGSAHQPLRLEEGLDTISYPFLDISSPGREPLNASHSALLLDGGTVVITQAQAQDFVPPGNVPGPHNAA